MKGPADWAVVVACAVFLVYCAVMVGDTLIDTWGGR